MGAAEETPLRTGWERDCPPGDTFVRDYMVAWAAMYEEIAHACAQRFARDDDLVMHDAGSSSLFLNTALVLQPAALTDAARLASRLRSWYRAAPGGPFTMFSPWPTPDLRPHGFQLAGHPPLMLRSPGDAAATQPPGLRLAEVRDAEGLAAYSAALSLGFPIPELTGTTIWPEEVLSVPGLHLWVGYEGSEPVTCAGAHVWGPLQHVEFVATRPEWRGRGFGEAVTWRATLVDPAKPAGLVASDAGRPVYERMGYVALTRFTLWIGDRPPPA